MKAKEIKEITDFMEKLGYEIVGIKEREEGAVFKASIEIRITPITKTKNTKRIMA